MPASSSFASIRLKAKVEKAFRMSYCLVFRPESLPIKNVATPTRATVPATEVDVAVHALNRMLELGRPESVRIA